MTKVTYSPRKPWMVRVPPSLQQIEGAKKKFFEKEAVAKAYKERLGRMLANYQFQAAELPDALRLEAFECFSKLKPFGASLRAAVDHYVAYLEKSKASIPVRKLIEEFLQAKQQDGMSSRYIADLRCKLGRFESAFGDHLASDITSQQLDTWLREVAANVTSRDSYRRNIRVLFEAARQKGYCEKNPAAELRFKKRVTGEVTILSAEELRHLLQECSSELVPYIAICAFAGLRPTEAASLDWSDIHLEAGQIEVKAKHSKTRRHRLVPIQPNLRAWLTWYYREGGKVPFSRRKFREAYRKAGFKEWPADVLRHSFGTYRLPIIKSAEALALEMGNSPDVIFRHYRRPTTDSAAAAYFNVMPTDRFRPAFRILSDPEAGPLSKEIVKSNSRNSPNPLDANCRKAA